MSSRASTPEIAELLAHRSFLVRLARSLVVDEGTAEDLVQDAYLVALGGGAARADRPRAWLAGVVWYLVRLRRRSEKRRSAREEKALAAGAEATPLEAAARFEVVERVVAAVRGLPEPYRSTVVHRYYDDLSPAEIAARTGVPVQTVKTRLKRAKARLRARLDGEVSGGRSAWLSALAPLALARPRIGLAARIAGGALLKAKTQTLWFLLPLCGVAAGVAGTVIFGPIISSGGAARPPSARLAAVTLERDRLKTENARMSKRLGRLTAERSRLLARVDEAERRAGGSLSRAAVASGAAGSTAKAPQSAASKAPSVDWKKWLPVLQKLAAWDPSSGKPFDPKLHRELESLLARLSRQVGHPLRTAQEVWSSPAVASQIVAAAANQFGGGLNAEDRASLAQQVKDELASIDSGLPPDATGEQKSAALLSELAAADDSVAKAANSTVAGRVTGLIQALFQQSQPGTQYLGKLSKAEFSNLATKLLLFGTGAGDEAKKAAAAAGADWWSDGAAAVQSLSASYGADMVRAALTRKDRAAPDLQGFYARSDFPSVQAHVQATFGALQAKYSRRVYDTLTDAQKKASAGFVNPLILFMP